MTEYNHKEAFCLMNYRCEKCFLPEVLWNSRDGVTPFTLPCAKCGKTAVHINFAADKCTPDALELMPDTMRVFVDLTKERAVEFATRRMLSFVDHPRYPAPPKDSEDWRRLVAGLAEDFFKDGTGPDIITAKELRERTT